MKYYCYNNSVEIYNKQPLLQDAAIINILNPSQNDIEFVTDFVKNNGNECKKNSYITLVKGTRKKFIKNDKSKRKIKMLDHAPKPIFFYTPTEPTPTEPTPTEPTPIEPTPIEPTPNELNILETINDDCLECDNKIEEFKKQVGCLIGIKKGDKLYLDGNKLCVDNSYNGFSRMIKNMFWAGYNRNNVMDKLECIFSIDLSKAMKHYREYLIEIKKGLTNLLETYIDDSIMKSRLSNIINKLD